MTLTEADLKKPWGVCPLCGNKTKCSDPREHMTLWTTVPIEEAMIEGKKVEV